MCVMIFSTTYIRFNFPVCCLYLTGALYITCKTYLAYISIIYYYKFKLDVLYLQAVYELFSLYAITVSCIIM